MVRLGEILIRRRTLSAIILTALLFVFATGVRGYVAEGNAQRQRELAYEHWISLVRSTLLQTTMAASDASKFHVPLAFWNESALSTLAEKSPRARLGTDLHNLIHGLYSALERENTCNDMAAVLEKDGQVTVSDDRRDPFLSRIQNLRASNRWGRC